MRPNVFPVRLTVSNAFVVQGRRTILVDTGQPGNGRTILRRLARHGIEPRDVSLILLTHGHIDHYGSAAELQAATGAPIAIHAADADNLRNGRNPLLTPCCAAGGFLRPFFQNQHAPACEPDLLLDEDFPLEDYGVPGRILHTPGHSAGSVSLLLEGGQALIGDLLMGGVLGGYLFERRPGFPYFLNDPGQNLASIRRLLGQHLTSVFVGHGGPLTPAAIRGRFGE